MNELLELFFVSGDLVTSFFKLVVLVIGFDTVIGVAHAIGTIKGSVS